MTAKGYALIRFMSWLDLCQREARVVQRDLWNADLRDCASHLTSLSDKLRQYEKKLHQALHTAVPTDKETKMKHARDDYNRIQDPQNRIPDDEPVFLIRGQDIVAAEVVRHWAQLNDERGGDPELSRRARAQAVRMDAWTKKKTADL